MLFIVDLNHVIATSAAHVQVSFQQIQLRLCPPLALTHARSLVKVISLSYRDPHFGLFCSLRGFRGI